MTTRRPASTPSKKCRPSSPTRTASAARSPHTPIGAQGILWATEAGVDSIEHGTYINDECIAAMKKHGTYLVPTAYRNRLGAAVRPPACRSMSRR